MDDNNKRKGLYKTTPFDYNNPFIYELIKFDQSIQHTFIDVFSLIISIKVNCNLNFISDLIAR